MSWNPNDDYRPPPLPLAADMEDVQTAWGILPRWKARALALGEIQVVVNELHGGMTTRADSAAGNASAPGYETKPPPLAADEAEDEPPAVDPDLLDAVEAKLDELAGRMDRLERTKRAEQALLALEDEIERRYPLSDDDDDDDMTLKPRRH
jgi:hypothetical protein